MFKANSIRISYTGNRGVKLITSPNLNEVLPNSLGYKHLPATARALPKFPSGPAERQRWRFQLQRSADLNNRFNMAYWRGPMVGIPYQRFITDFVWDLPFGKGRVEVDDDGESPAEGGRDASSAA